MSDDLDREMAARHSKNSSRGIPDIKLAPRSVGSFTVNTCRNALCPSFAMAPVVLQVSHELKTGNIKSGGEQRAYECGQCGQSSAVKSNIALVQEYSRLRTLHRGTNREYCLNDGCTSHRVPQSLMPSAYIRHGKTPKGDPRYQCRDCKRTFSVGSPKRRHRETTETGEIMKLLVNNVPLRRILEITDISPARFYNRIDFLADQCRNMAATKERNLWRGFKDHNRVISTDVQTILANWRHAHRVLNVPIRHAVSVERDTGYAIAATTDFDPDTDPSEVQEAMQAVDDFSFPRAYRQHGRVWAREEYEDSVLRGVQNVLSDEEKMVNLFDIPGEGARVRGDIFQAAHMMLVKMLIGDAFVQVLYAIDGDIGLAKLTSVLNARDVMAGRVHVADVRFKKELGNRKRNKLVKKGEQMMRHDKAAFASTMDIAETAYHLESEIVRLVAARLLW